MKIQEYIQALHYFSEVANENGQEFRQALPLGFGEDGNAVFAHKEICPARYHHVCVTGEQRSEYICRLVLSLCKLYGQDNVSFLILSPNKIYGELLHVKDADITVPFVHRYEDCASSLDALRELVRMRAVVGDVLPKLYVVLDGLEDAVESVGEQQSFECFKPFFDVVGTSGVEIITGVDLEKSIFSAYPGAFIGHGNALVSTDVLGKADVTYVGVDSCLSLPISIQYPETPSMVESVLASNANE